MLTFTFLFYALEKQWHPTPVLLPGKSHGWKSLEGCSPWGHWGSDTTKRLHFHFSFSCMGEGNGNPLQFSCLENPREGGAWWAAIYGVEQSRTWLKRLSSSSSFFREELQQRIWGRGLFQEGPLGSCQVTDSFKAVCWWWSWSSHRFKDRALHKDWA